MPGAARVVGHARSAFSIRLASEVLTACLKEQDAKIQSVNDKVELSKPEPRTVENNQ